MSNKIILCLLALLMSAAFMNCGGPEDKPKVISLGNSCYDRQSLTETCSYVCDQFWAFKVGQTVYLFETELDCQNELNPISIE